MFVQVVEQIFLSHTSFLQKLNRVRKLNEGEAGMIAALMTVEVIGKSLIYLMITKEDHWLQLGEMNKFFS